MNLLESFGNYLFFSNSELKFLVSWGARRQFVWGGDSKFELPNDSNTLFSRVMVFHQEPRSAHAYDISTRTCTCICIRYARVQVPGIAVHDLCLGRRNLFCGGGCCLVLGSRGLAASKVGLSLWLDFFLFFVVLWVASEQGDPAIQNSGSPPPRRACLLGQ